jgi:hypothetical protein
MFDSTFSQEMQTKLGDRLFLDPKFIPCCYSITAEKMGLSVFLPIDTLNGLLSALEL